MKIAFFDHVLTQRNAIGKCNLGILKALCHEHEFTVFSVEFDNPCPKRIRWVHVPAIRRPLALLFITFHMLAPLFYLWHRLRWKARFHLVQMVESNLMFGDISYSHFCHRYFLKSHWDQIRSSGLRGRFRWLDHWLHSLMEPRTYRNARWIIVPSQGLARELTAAYPFAGSKIRVLSNPVDVDLMRRPAGFNGEQLRQQLGFLPSDIVLAFVALGHYERKGLPNLLDALKICASQQLKLVVVGGDPGLVAQYEVHVRELGLEQSIVFVGKKSDIRPYLWASNALILPSLYEVFPLVALEAAAAGLPVLATPLNGIEEFLRDGANGFTIRSNDAEGISACLSKFAILPATNRESLGLTAQRSVEQYDPISFARAWSGIYREVVGWT
jgi:glycosyltransferase involved in cell wall biosynthesis